MSLRNILARFTRAGQNALELALTVESRPSALGHKDFREFTAPQRQQRGGSVQLGARHADRIGRIGIIPGMGGNIP